MRILTLIRQVPDAEDSVRVDSGAVVTASGKLVMDTMDEYGVEAALRLRDQGAEVEIVGVGFGPARMQDALRTALAMGVDRAIHVETEMVLDAVDLSRLIAVLAKEEQADLVLCGGQQADWDSQALGAATAERLGWPQVTWATALLLDAGVLQGKHDVDAGSETFSVGLPVVVTTQQGLNEPRYPTLPGILKAKKKEMRKEAIERFGVVSSIEVTGVAIQPKKRLGRIVDGRDASAAAAGLVSFLRDEARVIP